MEETWKQTIQFPNRVEVSNLGNVRSLDYLAPSKRALQPTQLRKGKVLSPELRDNGYLSIKITTANMKQRQYVHRLVAAAFCDGWFEGACVDHLDGNRLNNKASNLEWVTLAENSRRQNADGRGAQSGEAHPMAKLSNANRMLIPELRSSGMSVAHVAEKFGVSTALIYKIEKGLRRVAD